MTQTKQNRSWLGPFQDRFVIKEILFRDPGFTLLLARDRQAGNEVQLQRLYRAHLSQDKNLVPQWEAIKSCQNSLWFRPQEFYLQEHWAVMTSLVPPGRAFSQLPKIQSDEDYLKWMADALKDLALIHGRGLLHLAQNERTWILFRPEEESAFNLGLGDLGVFTEVPMGPPVSVPAVAAVAPEVLAGTTVDHRADLYSLACLILRQRSAHRFRFFKTLPKVLELHRQGRMQDLVPPSESRLNQILRKMLAPDPRDRPQEVAEALEWVDPQAKLPEPMGKVMTGGSRARARHRILTLVLNTVRTLLDLGESELTDQMLQNCQEFLSQDHEHYLKFFQSRLATLGSDVEGANELRRQAMVKCYSRPDPKLKSQLLLEEAKAAEAEGQMEKARESIQEAWKAVSDFPDYLMQSHVLYRLGLFEKEQGRWQEAVRKIQGAKERLPAHETPAWAPKVAATLAEILASHERPRQALRILEKISLAPLRSPRDQARIFLQKGLVYLANAQWESAADALGQAGEIYSREQDLVRFLWSASHALRLPLAMADQTRAKRKLKELRNRLRDRTLHQELLDLLELNYWLRFGELPWSELHELMGRVEERMEPDRREEVFQDVAWPRWKSLELYGRALGQRGNFVLASELAEEADRERRPMDEALARLGYGKEGPVEGRVPLTAPQAGWSRGEAVQVESLVHVKPQVPTPPASEPAPLSQEILQRVQKLEYHLQEVKHLKQQMLEKKEKPRKRPPKKPESKPSKPQTKPVKDTVPKPAAAPAPTPAPSEVAQAERDQIEAALRKFQGNKSKAAKELKVNRRTLFEKIKKYGLDQLDFLPGKKEIEQALAECEGNRSVAAKKLGMSRSSFYRRMKELGLG